MSNVTLVDADGVTQLGVSGRSLVTQQGSSLIVQTASFVPAVGYAAGNNMGGLFTLALGASFANKSVRLRRISAALSAATISAIANIQALLLNASPTTAFADAATPTWNVADNVKLMVSPLVPMTNTGIPTLGTSQNAATAGITNSQDVGMSCNASGQLFLAVQALGTITLVTPSGLVFLLEFNT